MTIARSIKKMLGKLKWSVLSTVAGWPRLSALYFAVFDDGLSREASGVLAGRIRYRQDTADIHTSYFLLRRNVHRLEKGLIMRPRRRVFAVDFIGDTISVYARAIRHAHGKYTNEHRWATDVLREYFRSVDKDHPEIAPHWAKFQALKDLPATEVGERRSPYIRDHSRAAPVSIEAFSELSMRRRSVRWFLEKPVPRDLIDRALAVANQAPSACNRQPFIYRVFDDPHRARAVAALALGTKGFCDNIPAVAALVGRLRAYPFARDRHAIYVDGGLSAMAFMYALETMNLSSCPINWADIQPQERMIAEALSLDPDERVVMLIAFGWPDPDGMVPYSAKRDLDELRLYSSSSPQATDAG